MLTSTVVTAWTILDENKSTSPFTFHVNLIPNTNGSTSDTPYCHLWFPNSSVGNSVQWTYDLAARDIASTFGAVAVLASSTIATSGSTSVPLIGATSSVPIVTETATTAVTASSAYHATPTTTYNSNSATATAVSTGPSPGVSAFPIILAIGLFVIISLIVFGTCFWIRRRRRRRWERALAPAELAEAPARHELEGVQRVEMGHNIREHYAPPTRELYQTRQHMR